MEEVANQNVSENQIAEKRAGETEEFCHDKHKKYLESLDKSD